MLKYNIIVNAELLKTGSPTSKVDVGASKLYFREKEKPIDIDFYSKLNFLSREIVSFLKRNLFIFVEKSYQELFYPTGFDPPRRLPTRSKLTNKSAQNESESEM